MRARLVAILAVVFLTVDVAAGLLEFALDACALAGGKLAAGATVEGFLCAYGGLFGGESLRLAERQFAVADALPDAGGLSPLPRIDRLRFTVRVTRLRFGREREC